MLRPRLIVCLLVHNGGLVKTLKFSDPKYVGDPVNAVRIYNEKEVDELIVVDIDATREGREPDYAMIRNLANECRMPLCYGGGVTSVEQVERIIGLGVEKVAISAKAVSDMSIVSKAAERVGSQSVVVVMDVKKSGLLRHYEVFTHNGTRKTGLSPVEFAKKAAQAGAGEIVVNAIERDGTMQGYDLPLIAQVRESVGIPITAIGGAGSLDDFKTLYERHQIIGAAAGSFFVFKGKFRAVLISYPARAEKLALMGGAGAAA